MSICRVSFSAILAAAYLAVAGCNFSATTETGAPAAVEAAAPLVAAAGEPEILTPLSDEDPGVGAALAVVKLDNVPNQSDMAAVRLFGIAGGDPAMNGLKTYLAFVTPHDARGFLIGDFYDYRVIGASPGQIDLEIDEHVMDDAGEIVQRTRRVIVSWTEMPQQQSSDPEFPSTVTATPAQ